MSTLSEKDVKGLQDQTGMVEFADALVGIKKEAGSIGGVYDSAEMTSVIADKAPSVLNEVLETVPADKKSIILGAIYDGVTDHQKHYGKEVRGDILENAVRGAAFILNGKVSGVSGSGVYDSAFSNASGAPMQVNRAAVSIYQALAETAVPFAGYIPMNEGLEGRIIIVQHEAGSTCGAYKTNESMDGVNLGKNYTSTARYVDMKDNAGKWEAVIPYAKGDTEGVPIISSATELFVDGESVLNAPNYGERVNGSFTLSGSVEINGTKHTVSCQGNTLKGTIEAIFSPVLPAGVEVEVVGHVDYEHDSMKEKRPKILVSADMRPFRATFLSGLYRRGGFVLVDISNPSLPIPIKSIVAYIDIIQGCFMYVLKINQRPILGAFFIVRIIYEKNRDTLQQK